MVFIIYANGKSYLVTEHAAMRMIQRFINEELVIQILEDGNFWQRASDGCWVYEYHFEDESGVKIYRAITTPEDDIMMTVEDVSQ